MLFLVLFFAFPTLLIFNSLFIPGPVVWGDAPYFYDEGLKELVTGPFIWNHRAQPLGGINSLLWLSPLLFIYGILNTIFGLSNDFIIRILFYFPAILFSIITPFLFARYIGCSRISSVFASLFYTFNTYFLLLIDGGQVGVALAYGIFPLALLSIKKLSDSQNIRSFFSALIVSVVLMAVDVRISIIAFFTFLVWSITERVFNGKKMANFKAAFLLFMCTFIIGAYWIIPLFNLGGLGKIELSNEQFVTLFNSFFLFHPHWPMNEFGRVSNPPFYFIGVPFLVFGSILFNKKLFKIYLPLVFCFLIFVFLAKGASPPVGKIYEFLVSEVPFGSALRDSTKFFTPLILLSGILIGNTISLFSNSLKKHMSYLFLTGTYIYLLFLVYPALIGNMSGVLAKREFNNDFRVIYEKIRDKQSSFRSAWFPERHPFAFQTEVKDSLDAKNLVELRPFASLNVGTFDRFNFMHNSEFLDWFNLLGIKYLFFSGDNRKHLDDEEAKDWDSLLTLVDSVKGLSRESWGTEMSIYSSPNIKPRIFGVDKAFIVIGSDDVYRKLKAIENTFSATNQGFLFPEEGKFDLLKLKGVDPKSLIIIFNERKEEDLTMSFLQNHFVDLTKTVVTSHWAHRGTDQYLKWKYEFLQNKVVAREFDYGKGIAFSSIPDEEVKVSLDAPEDGEYMLATRALTRAKSEVLTYTFDKEERFAFEKEGEFEWNISGPFKLEKGKRSVSFKNVDGFHSVNTVALISKKNWESAKELTRNFMSRFKVVNLTNENRLDVQFLLKDQKWREIDYRYISPVEYEIGPTVVPSWIVFTDRYDPGWNSFPFYSMVNGYYNDPKLRLSKIIFEKQKFVSEGMRISALAIFILASFFVWFYSRRKR